MHHMQMLESTGLVRYQELPPAAIPAAQDNSRLAIAEANSGSTAAVNPALMWAMLLAAIGVAAAMVVRLRRSGS